MADSDGAVLATCCTIATASHLEQALACLNSIREHQPQVRCVLLLIGQGPPAERQAPGISFLSVEECIPADQLRAMSARYTIAELCFAAKPYLMRALLVGAAQVHYFDGDCCAYGSITPLFDALAQSDVLLTPHSLTPIPDDGLRPRPLTILRAGAFNAGYLGVRATTQGREFLDWLAAMTLKYARNDPKAGMCGDQKWLDLVPALFAGAAICRNWGANVAYWNLHERALTLDQGRLLVNGQPLIFFHFSGYEPNMPMRLSKYQDRTQAPTGSPLEWLLRNYRSRLAVCSHRSAPRRGRLRRLWRRIRLGAGSE